MSSTGPSRPEDEVFYLDESIHSRVLVERLLSIGVEVRYPGRDIPYGAQDEIWLAACGRFGWIVLMRDQRIRYRTLERRALVNARVGAFVLTAGQATAIETADAVERLVRTFRRIASQQTRPFLFSFGLRGTPRRILLNG